MKKILICGFAGHIGSALIRALPEYELYLLDDFSTGNRSSLFDLNRNYTLIEGDICTITELPDVDVVIHLAALTDNKESFDKANEYSKVNIYGLINIATLCEKKGIKLLFPSTTAVRTDDSPYIHSKVKAEEYLDSTSKLQYTVLRFGGVFGYSVGMKFHTVINKFVWQAVHKKPVTVWKTAMNQVRPYLDLKDCVAAIKHIVDTDNFWGETYDCQTESYSIKEILEAIPVEKNVILVDSPSMNDKIYNVSSQAIIETGFSFKGNLYNSIREIINHVKTSY